MIQLKSLPIIQIKSSHPMLDGIFFALFHQLGVIHFPEIFSQTILTPLQNFSGYITKLPHAIQCHFLGQDEFLCLG